MIRRILTVLADREYSAAAISHSLSLAKAHGAEVTAVTMLDVDRLADVGAIPLGGSGAAVELRESRLEQTRKIIEETTAEFRSACERAGRSHKVYTEKGDPFEKVGRLARYHDIVVGGLNKMFEHGVIDEPSDELMRLVSEGVRPMLAVSADVRPVRRVLIAYSGSSESAKTMKRFVQMRPWDGIETKIVTFRTPHGDPGELLEDSAAYVRAHGYEVETDFVDQPARSGLLPYADQWDADVIVIGNSAQKTFFRKMFGETALNAMRNSQRTLFLSQ